LQFGLKMTEISEDQNQRVLVEEKGEKTELCFIL